MSVSFNRSLDFTLHLSRPKYDMFQGAGTVQNYGTLDEDLETVKRGISDTAGTAPFWTNTLRAR